MGSEMCIRDRNGGIPGLNSARLQPLGEGQRSACEKSQQEVTKDAHAGLGVFFKEDGIQAVGCAGSG